MHRKPGRATGSFRGRRFAVPTGRDVAGRLALWATDPMTLVVGVVLAYAFAVLSVGARMAP